MRMNHSEVNENKPNKNCLCKNKYFLLFLILLLVAVLLLAKFRSSPKRVLWSEGIASAGVMAEILKEYACINGGNGRYPPTWEDLESFVGGVCVSEDEGNFRKKHISWEADYEPDSDPPIEFKIIITRPPGCDKPEALMLNEKWELFHLDDDGKWIQDSFRSSDTADTNCYSIKRMYYITGKLSQEPKK
jgi:hypothetical protein